MLATSASPVFSSYVILVLTANKLITLHNSSAGSMQVLIVSPVL